MPLPLDRLRTLLASLDRGVVPNRIAQANARHVLYEVGEAESNFPDFDAQLTEKVTFVAYAQLAVGCSLREGGDHEGGVVALEQGASLLTAAHGPLALQSPESGFHVLIAAMAFYAAGQYSRAFVAVREAELRKPPAAMIAAFLRKDIRALIARLNDTFLGDAPAIEDQDALDQWAVTLTISRALALVLEYTLTGLPEHLAAADGHLQDGLVVAEVGRHVGWWWTLRLLRLMLTDLGEASPWTVLPPFFGSDPDSLRRYVQLLAFGKRPVVELWRSQRAALPLCLDRSSSGAVVNLRTSAGKTRVAELAALQTLLDNPSSRVLYLAPFRSLALEVEQSFGAIFPTLGFSVSHLYGGARVSSIDTQLANDASLIIATPEKTRALFRAAPQVFNTVKLIVIDEGHLVGMSGRHVPNELFVDHLRVLAKRTGARILLMSAVLPNPQELAEWVTGDETRVARSLWKPSAERFGLLRWDGRRVRIEWQGTFPSFNPSFVEAHPLGWGRRRRAFPADKHEAIAATAVRLTSIGPVMIFTARATSVATLARAVLLELGEAPPDHPWPRDEWKVFEAVCTEELEADALELRAARYGVICHSNRLTPQVRQAMEHLMRAAPPKVIVATSTLAQGVNVGVSSVIVATPYYSQESISTRDFWNICGRAGRAFVDGEGKILYAIDDTREAWQVRRDEVLAQGYFDAGGKNAVQSGLLASVVELRATATSAGIGFDQLLEMVAENDFSPCGENAGRCAEICDYVDDGLLALHEDPAVNPTSAPPATWIDSVFRHSLAGIQARSTSSAGTVEEVLRILASRAQGVARLLPEDTARKAVVASALPFSVARRMHQSLEVFRSIADELIADSSLTVLVHTVSRFEEWLRSHGGAMSAKLPSTAVLDAIREGWLRGISLRDLTEATDEARDACKDTYGNQLPWIIHAASQQLRSANEEQRGQALEQLALLVELGVPNELAGRIFLAGIRSRVAATELSGVNAEFGLTISDVARNLRRHDFVADLQSIVSAPTAEWLKLLDSAIGASAGVLPEFEDLSAPDGSSGAVMLVRRRGDRTCLCRPDGSVIEDVGSTASRPFETLANDARLVLELSLSSWHLRARDPRLVNES